MSNDVEVIVGSLYLKDAEQIVKGIPNVSGIQLDVMDLVSLYKYISQGPHSDFGGPNSGSTTCVAVIRGEKLVVANAGDSRCVLSRKGQAHNLSKDHKPDLEVEKDRILKAGGFIQVGRVNGSLNLARAIVITTEEFAFHRSYRLSQRRRHKISLGR
ncbi:hypothetical protein Fmac_026939 [Flemingia macrophylla]|uniref:PPM-type phosphatase domain-containing protein n=1 Tax=Flemingia macrophylla TaxID=520843 RepID=A0ABD1LG99_9FABA